MESQRSRNLLGIRATTWIVILTILSLLLWLIGCMHRAESAERGSNLWGVEVWTSDLCPEIGQQILLQAKVTNLSDQLLVVDISEQPALDILIQQDTMITKWSSDKELTSELTHIELKPGESKQIQMDWVVQTKGFQVYARFLHHPDDLNDVIAPFLFIGGLECSLFGY